MMTLLRILTGFAGMFLCVFAAMRFATRRRRGLSSGPTLSERLLPIPTPTSVAEPPSFEERLKSVGIRVGESTEVGRGDQPLTMIGQLVACAQWPSTHRSHEVPNGCGSCQTYRRMYGIGEVVKIPPSGGAHDTGRAKMLLIGIVCASCGYCVGSSWFCDQPWKDWHDHRRLEELMGRETNFLEHLAHLERLQGAPLYERRRSLIEEELAQIDSRRTGLVSEKHYLEDTLGRLKGPPHRDRFLAVPLEPEEKSAERETVRIVPIRSHEKF